MLQNLSSLEETAERFRKSPEFIWNMSLQFNRLLQPELGENGLVAYSELQRHIIGRIIKMREEGMTDTELIASLADQVPPPPLEQPARTRCPSSDVCRKNFKALSEQVKLMRNQISLLNNEIALLKRAKSSALAPVSLDSLTTNQSCIEKKLLGLHHPDA